MYYSLHKSCDCSFYKFNFYYTSNYNFMHRLLLMRLVTWKFKYNKFVINNNSLFCNKCNLLIFEESSQEEFYSQKMPTQYNLDHKVIEILKLTEKNILELMKEN